jgi:prefoldin subunit 5
MTLQEELQKAINRKNSLDAQIQALSQELNDAWERISYLRAQIAMKTDPAGMSEFQIMLAKARKSPPL